MILLDEVQRWYEIHVESLIRDGVIITFGRTRDLDKPKHAAWVDLEAHGDMVDFIIWETGEAEYSTGTADNGTSEHLEIKTIEELRELLREILTRFCPE